MSGRCTSASLYPSFAGDRAAARTGGGTTMAHMNFDKAIAHFSTANTLASNSGNKALAELAAGLQRLSEALHVDIDRIIKDVEERGEPRPR